MDFAAGLRKDGADWRSRKVCLLLGLCLMVTVLYIMSSELYQQTYKNGGPFDGGPEDPNGRKNENPLPVTSPFVGKFRKRTKYKKNLLDVPGELVRSQCSTIIEELLSDGDDGDDEDDDDDAGMEILGGSHDDDLAVSVETPRSNERGLILEDEDSSEDLVGDEDDYEEEEEDYVLDPDTGVKPVGHDYDNSDPTRNTIRNSDVVDADNLRALNSGPDSRESFEYNPWKEAVSIRAPQFLDTYTNPCWVEILNSSQVYEKHYYVRGFKKTFRQLSRIWDRRLSKGHRWRLRCLPYFFVAGMPKSGTTDLFHKMALHPNVVRSTMKEPHWWTRRRYKPCVGDDLSCVPSDKSASFEEYVDIFDEAAECIRGRLAANGDRRKRKPAKMVVGEASASTFWDNDVWRLLPGNQPQNETDVVKEPRYVTADYIHDVIPQAKIIVIVRDPTARLYSDYLYFREDQSVTEFHSKVQEGISNMAQCMNNRTVRGCVYDRILNNYGDIPVRLRIGMYSVYLRDWLRVFPREQILVIRTEDYGQNPVPTLNKIYKFLNLDPMPKDIARIIRQLPKANTRHHDDVMTGDMLPETDTLIRQFYAKYNRELASLLNDDGFLWEKASTSQSPDNTTEKEGFNRPH